MRIAVVVPRFGPGIAGGAEALGRGVAETLHQQGDTVEVWSTCAQSHYTWDNEYPMGASSEPSGLVVRRFPVELRRKERRAALEGKLAGYGKLPRDEQYEWLECGPHSPALYEHIAQHAAAWDAVLVMPYAMQLTHWAAWAAPQRVVFWPCLHDEPYAYMEPTRLLLENVRGVAFNAPEEQTLAARHLRVRMAQQVVPGVGVPMAAEHPTAQHLAVEPSNRDLLYIGRLEEGKNVPLLYEYVQRFVAEGGDLRLVVLGSGPQIPPDEPAFDFRGFVSEEEKRALCAGALALCQPSLNESFSLTIMESWLGGRPALVHGACAVTRGHVWRSRGGLAFHTYADFRGAVEWLQQNPQAAARMGQNGARYVRANYQWQTVVERLRAALHAWGMVERVEVPA